MLEVTTATYIDGYRLSLTFNNGESKVADLGQSLDGQVFEPLKDISYFKQFRINFNTIEWPNGADFAPEYLYKISYSDFLKVPEDPVNYGNPKEHS